MKLQEMTNDEWWNRFAKSFLNGQNTLFDVRCWTFDVRRSSVSFSIWLDARGQRRRSYETTMEVRRVRFSWNGNQFKNARSADLAYRKPRLHNWPWRPPPGNRTTSVRLFALFSWKKNRPGPPNYPWKTNGFKAQLLINQRHIPCNSFAAIPLLELNWTNGPIIRVRKKCPSMCVYLLPIDFSIISAL